MKKRMNKKRFALGGSEGFTLIEVVLVLAIGGLIFLLAFLAFQQVSTNRRDTARRTNLNQIVGAIENYRADKLSLPPKLTVTGDYSAHNSAFNSYIVDLTDPSDGTKMSDRNLFMAAYTAAPATAVSTYSFTIGTTTAPYPKACNGTTDLNGNQKYAVRMKLEKGEACRDNL